MYANLPKVILLDMDDTILMDSGEADRCWTMVCDSYGAHIGERTPDELLTAINASRTWYWSDAERHRQGRLNLEAARERIVEAALQRLGIDDAHLAREIAQFYITQRASVFTSRPFPAAIETLVRLRALGIQLGLITNGQAVSQRRKIEQHGLAAYFDCLLIEGEFGVGKPDERIYRHALDQLEAQPEQTWMVGDHLLWDVAAPQRLGIYGIWHDFAGEGLPETTTVRPDRIIRAISELP